MWSPSRSVSHRSIRIIMYIHLSHNTPMKINFQFHFVLVFPTSLPKPPCLMIFAFFVAFVVVRSGFVPVQRFGGTDSLRIGCTQSELGPEFVE